MNAASDIRELLEEGEEVDGIVFGEWGWGHGENELGYGEPEPPPVPFEKRGKVMSLKEAEPYMEGWSFAGGFGAPECYAVYVWTNRRIFWVTQYDGATGLDFAPRNPCDCKPDMPGG